MATLVIVESPNKVQKVSECLGPGFTVLATVGHFRDLPQGELGVDLTTFEGRYEVVAEKSSVVARLRDAARRADAVLLGTDADREGEAIAWHVAEVLGLRGARRIRFQEITPRALKAAVAAAGPIDSCLVEAQHARRVLDRLVGYQVSPLLSFLGPHHSAGRVQSAALHLVVEREKAREAFRPVAFWTVAAAYGAGFTARAALQGADGQWAVARLTTAAEAASVEAEARACPHQVEALETTPTQRHPKAPFTTDTLQQAASAQLGLKPTDTMALAQALFARGLISYHRTDSTALSEDAVAMARAHIAREALPESPPRYRNAAGAQEAHEAIRPTAMELEPGVSLEADEESLYSLICRRFLASQCRPALLDVTTVRTRAGSARFLARGTVVREPGFLRYLAEDESTAAAKHEGQGDDEGVELPALAAGQLLEVADVAVKADATKPPPRFTQATLIRELKRTGIGRPSTYDATVGLLFERRYLEEAGEAVLPTPRGRLVDGALTAAVPEVVATENTARLEEQLDAIAGGRLQRLGALTAWHGRFSGQLAAAGDVLRRWAATDAKELLAAVGEAPSPTGKPCPRCGKELLLRHGAKGAFLACSGWPACDYRADPSARPSGVPCPKCGGPMVEQDGRFGRYARCSVSGCGAIVDRSVLTAEPCPRCGAPLKDKGQFLGCSTYPACSFTVEAKALAQARKSGATCPKCGKPLVKRKGPKGAFLGCVGYPTCRHTAQVPARRQRATP